MNSSSEHKHERKVCPACLDLFECKVGDVANCQCSTVKLKEDVQRHIQGIYGDCLCCHCLRKAEAAYYSKQLQSKIKTMLRLPGTST